MKHFFYTLMLAGAGWILCKDAVTLAAAALR